MHRLQPPVPVDHGFDRFIPTRGSREAFEQARGLAQGAEEAPRLLFLHGAPGVGKTHLLRSVLKAVQARQPSASVVRWTGAELRQELVDALRNESIASLRSTWARADVVALDDLHVLAGMPMTQREVAALLGVATNGGARVVCAAGCEPTALSVLAAALRALPGARQLLLRPPSGREMRRIVLGMATAKRIRVGREALASIAAAARGDVRRAAGALSRYRFTQWT